MDDNSNDDSNDEDSNNDQNGDDSQDDNSDGSDSEGGNDDEEEETKGKPQDLFTYRPVKGEDIYGRQLNSTEESGDAPKKYIPPAKRKEVLSKIDEVSDDYFNIGFWLSFY